MNEIARKAWQDAGISPDILSELESATIKLVEMISRYTVPALIKVVEDVNEYVHNSYRYISPRCLYLSKYAKKRRVRNKNKNRLMKMKAKGI